MHATTPITRFSELNELDARALLARNHIGRLAFTFRDRVDIQPIHYIYDERWLLGRTSVGSKLMKLAHHPWCALEVDEVHGPFHWDSVVVHGSFTMLDPQVGSVDLYSRAIERLQQLVPAAFTDDDPAPERVIPFAIHIDELHGRSARSESE